MPTYYYFCCHTTLRPACCCCCCCCCYCLLYLANIPTGYKMFLFMYVCSLYVLGMFICILCKLHTMCRGLSLSLRLLLPQQGAEGHRWQQQSCFDMNVSFAHLSSLINIFFYIFLFLILPAACLCCLLRRGLPERIGESEPVSWPFHACISPATTPKLLTLLLNLCHSPFLFSDMPPSHSHCMAFYVLHLSACICICSYS